MVVDEVEAQVRALQHGRQGIGNVEVTGHCACLHSPEDVEVEQNLHIGLATEFIQHERGVTGLEFIMMLRTFRIRGGCMESQEYDKYRADPPISAARDHSAKPVLVFIHATHSIGQPKRTDGKAS